MSAAQDQPLSSEEQAVMDKLLREAVVARDLAHIRLYVGKGADIHSSAGDVTTDYSRNGNGSSERRTAPLFHLMHSVGLRREIADFMIEQGVDVDVRDARGNTVLLLAVKGGDLETAKYLLSKGADPFAKNNSGEITLEIARNAHAYYHSNRQQLIDALVNALPDVVRSEMEQGAPVTEDTIKAAAAAKPEKQAFSAPKTASFGAKPRPRNNNQFRL
ncbi:MAG TPA: ankyrin repeat domain-containing protein [Patescibacteria group bacterium]|nr:ankyrin repeat domain-containing protein [Patescibacteria group bacterium]